MGGWWLVVRGLRTVYGLHRYSKVWRKLLRGQASQRIVQHCYTAWLNNGQVSFVVS